MAMTLEQIRQKGLDVLRRELGPVDMIRFMQQFENGSGDYATERHAWVDATSLDDLRGQLLAGKSQPKKLKSVKKSKR